MRRPPAPPTAANAAGEARARVSLEGPRSTYTAERSPRRTVLLIAAGVVVVAAGVAVALTSLGGSSGGKALSATSRATTRHGAAAHKGHSSKSRSSAPKTPAASPAETDVAVLNATETNGLAHRTAAELQQGGYSQATALNGRPPGSGQVSVVEYASGHQAEAEGVARSAGVTHVQPIEAAVSALSGSATVVVIVGDDKAASSP